MKRLGYLILGLLTLLFSGSAWAATCTVPYTFVNGTVADGGQVTSDFNAVLACINNFGTAGLTISGGDLIIQGSNSGAVTIHPQANAGTYNFNLPTIAGISGLPLLSGGGGFAPMTWGVLGVAGGGTGLLAGISGGIPAFTGATTLSSSGLLVQHALILGGGAGAVPYTLGSLGTTTTVLHGNATGDPSYAAVQNADLANSSVTIGTTTIALGATSLTLAGLTSVNKVTLTAPATGSTLTIADGKTLTANNTLTLAGVDGKTLTLNNTLTLAGTDATTMTFPSTSQTIAGLGVANIFTVAQTVNLNAASLQAATAGTVFQAGQANGTVSRILVDAYAANPNFTCRRADTSALAPSAIQSGEQICGWGGIGYGQTGYSGAARGSLNAIAAEIWTDTAQGAYLTWQTTPAGGTSTAEKMRLNASGNLSIGDTTDTDRLHVTGAVHLTTNLLMDGSGSGTLTVKPAATAGSNTLTLPAGTTDFSATGGTSQVVKQTSAGGALTVARLACADLSDSNSGCSASTGVTIGTTSIALGGTTLTLAGLTSVNKWIFTAPTTAATLTAGGDSQTYTLPALTDTILGRASTDTLTNKTLDSGGTGNVVKIAGAQVPAAAGSSGQYLTSQGAAVQEIWTNPCAPLAAGTGISVTGTTTCTIANTGATVSIPGPNLLCNPWLDIDQANEGASISLTTGNTYFTVDCWDVNFVSVGGATGVTAQQSLADAPPGYPASEVLTVGTGHVIGIGERLSFQQNLEGNNLTALQWGTSSGKPVQLQVWLKSNQGSAIISGALQELISPFRGTSFECPALSANTWTLCSVSIPADTTGAWTLSSTTAELQVVISAACGTSAGQQITAGVWANGTGVKACGTVNQTNLNAISGAQLRIGPVKLEVSAAATPITRESYSADLARAQRYYEKSWSIGTAVANGTGAGASIIYCQACGTSAGVTVAFKATKACAAAIVMYAVSSGTSSKVRDAINAADVTPTLADQGQASFLWLASPSAGTNYNMQGHWTADCRL